MSDLREPLELYEAELTDIADAIGERSEGDAMSDDAGWTISLPAGHWRCLEAYIRAVLAVPAQAEESSEQPPLDRAWAAVNVLGAPDTACRTPEELAYCRGIGDALAEIEKLGGKAS